MSINIKGVSSKSGQTATSKVSGGNKSARSNATNTASQKPVDDSVDLTEAASKIQLIEQSLVNVPIIDDTQVQAISTSIKDGVYQVDNEKVADRILTAEKQLSTTQIKQKT